MKAQWLTPWLLLADLVVATACRRPVAPEPMRAPVAQPSAGLELTPTRVPDIGQPAETNDVSTDALPEAPTWTTLPDDLTRTAHTPLHRGDRLFAGRDDGIWELNWWGKPKKRLNNRPVLQLRQWDARHLIGLDAQRTVAMFDLATGESHRIAGIFPRSPTQDCGLPCRLGLDNAALQTWTLLLDRQADRICLAGWAQTDHNGQWQQEHVRAVLGVTTGTWSDQDVTADCETILDASEDGGEGDTAAAQGLSDRAPLPYYEINDASGQIMHRSKDFSTRAIAVTALAKEAGCSHVQGGPVSSSGRWQLVYCRNSPSIPSSWPVRFVLDRSHGSWHDVGDGPWRNWAFRQENMGGAGMDRWLPHSDVLLIDNLVLIPGFGGYRPGTIAR